MWVNKCSPAVRVSEPGTPAKIPRNESAYPLKAPNVVFLPVVFFFGRFFCIFLWQDSQYFWTLWPWPLTYDLDLKTCPKYPSTWCSCQNLGLYVNAFSRKSETNGWMDAHTYLRRCYMTHTYACSLCATLNSMEALSALLIFHRYKNS